MLINFRRNHLSAKRKTQASRRAQNLHDSDNVIGINNYVQHKRPVTLLPKDLKQEEDIDRLINSKKQIVFATGPAGTGKTMLAVMAAIKAFKEGNINKIIITRPAVGQTVHLQEPYLKQSLQLRHEAQNATINQMKMVLTRLSEGSKLIVTGDLNQMDRKFTTDNGLRDFIERLESAGSSSIASVHFSRRDVQRHPVVAEVLKLYGDS